MRDLLVVDDHKEKNSVHRGKMRANRAPFFSPGTGDAITCPAEGQLLIISS